MADEKKNSLLMTANNSVRVANEVSDRNISASANSLGLLDLLPQIGVSEHLHHEEEVFSARLAEIRAESDSASSDSKAEEVLLSQVLNWIHPSE